MNYYYDIAFTYIKYPSFRPKLHKLHIFSEPNFAGDALHECGDIGDFHLRLLYHCDDP